MPGGKLELLPEVRGVLVDIEARLVGRHLEQHAARVRK